MFPLSEIRRAVTHYFGTELGDRKIWCDAASDGAHFGCFCEQPGQRQRAGQNKLGEPPVRINFDGFAQVLEPMHHTPEIDIGNPDKEVPMKKKWVARTESYRLRDMPPSLPRPPEEELHQPEIGICCG